MSENNQQTSTALWYFVGGTFCFALPTTLFQGLPWWARIAFAVVGFVVLIAGFVQLNREMAAKRRADTGTDTRTDSTPGTGDDDVPPPSA